MRIWQFTEQSYHPGWDRTDGPLRILPPSGVLDPPEVSDLLHRYLDEWLLGDELGFDLMVNEHHASLTCMSAVNLSTMAILARQTKKARLLSLGVPMANRTDPLRIAEELAIIDNLSRGRLEFGFVKGSAWELFISNENPARMMDRFWEAHDLVLKAFATRDGPFSWEGEYFNYRHVNVIPPIYQYPCPPMWLPASSPDSARLAGTKGYVVAAFLNGHQAKNTFAAYREAYRAAHGRPAGLDRLAYLGMAVVAHSEAEARRRAEKLYAYYSTVSRSPAATMNPPGYSPVAANAKALLHGGGNPYANIMADGKPLPANPTLEMLADTGILFWGTPDMVYDQVTRFNDLVGGVGNFLCMTQGGYLTHEETVDSLKLLATEVYPRLKEIALPQAAE